MRVSARCFGVVVAWMVFSSGSAEAQYVTIVNNGPSSNRVDMVFLGDGYTAADFAAGAYENHIDGYLDYLFAPGVLVDPYPRYRNFFNVHRVDVVSNQSGADRPSEGIYRDTALDASYSWDGVTERLLYVSEFKAGQALNQALAGAGFEAEQRYVTVNDEKYGGGGGRYAVFAGGNAFAHEVALHEMGHSFSGLGDEYGGYTWPYVGGERWEPNLTTDPTGSKWDRWLGLDQPGVGVIGAYEGGGYHEKGLYRPSPNSKMRALNNPFDAVGREKIILDIYEHVRPLDGWRDNSGILTNPGSLWVDRVDDDVISMEWYVNGGLVAGVTSGSFDPVSAGFGVGVYTVMARAFDSTGFDPIDGWVRMNSEKLEEYVSWEVVVTAAVPEPSALGMALWGVVGGVTVALRRRGVF